MNISVRYENFLLSHLKRNRWIDVVATASLRFSINTWSINLVISLLDTPGRWIFCQKCHREIRSIEMKSSWLPDNPHKNVTMCASIYMYLVFLPKIFSCQWNWSFCSVSISSGGSFMTENNCVSKAQMEASRYKNTQN